MRIVLNLILYFTIFSLYSCKGHSDNVQYNINLNVLIDKILVYEQLDDEKRICFISQLDTNIISYEPYEKWEKSYPPPPPPYNYLSFKYLKLLLSQKNIILTDEDSLTVINQLNSDLNYKLNTSNNLLLDKLNEDEKSNCDWIVLAYIPIVLKGGDYIIISLDVINNISGEYYTSSAYIFKNDNDDLVIIDDFDRTR